VTIPVESIDGNHSVIRAPLRAYYIRIVTIPARGDLRAALGCACAFVLAPPPNVHQAVPRKSCHHDRAACCHDACSPIRSSGRFLSKTAAFSAPLSSGPRRLHTNHRAVRFLELINERGDVRYSTRVCPFRSSGRFHTKIIGDFGQWRLQGFSPDHTQNRL
jgi:hypothetical protein